MSKEISLQSASPQFTNHSFVFGPFTLDAVNRLLFREGQIKPLAGMTKGGTKLDGTPGKCATPDSITKAGEKIENLPWGRYRIAVYSQAKAFCSSTRVFVNPGKTGMTWDLVAPLYGGGPPDGGVPDGGVMSCP